MTTTKPTQLQTLSRYFDHGYDEEAGIRWSVSGGGLEANMRHYRVMLQVEGKKHEHELSIDTRQCYEDVLRQLIKDVLELLPYGNWEFAISVKKMIYSDPWLSYADKML
jgi:hypothetical protein